MFEVDFLVNALIFADYHTGFVSVKKQVVAFATIGIADKILFQGEVDIGVGIVPVVN